MSVVFINIYTVKPKDQKEMLEIVVGAVDNFACKQPGYISAKIHRSLDQTHIAEVVEWETREDWNQAHELCKATNPDVDRVLAIASTESHLYERVHEKSR